MVCGSFFFLLWTLSELNYNTYYYYLSKKVITRTTIPESGPALDSSVQLLHAHYLTKFALIMPIIHTIISRIVASGVPPTWTFIFLLSWVFFVFSELPAMEMAEPSWIHRIWGWPPSPPSVFNLLVLTCTHFMAGTALGLDPRVPRRSPRPVNGSRALIAAAWWRMWGRRTRRFLPSMCPWRRWSSGSRSL